MYDEVITLVRRSPETTADGLPVIDADGRQSITEKSREVFCRRLNIGMKEFYQASAVGRHPEAKVALPDYLDYDNEPLADFDGQLYRIMRTYRTGLELELTLEKAPEEDGVAHG